MTRGLVALAAVLAVALVFGGCGGGGAADGSAGELAKATFIKRADAICSKAYNQIKAGYQPFAKRARGEPFSDFGEISEFADTVLIPAKKQELDELSALGAPGGDRERVEAILAAYEEGIEKAEASPRDAVSSSAGVFVKATELAQRYGLKNCHY